MRYGCVGSEILMEKAKKTENDYFCIVILLCFPNQRLTLSRNVRILIFFFEVV